MRETTTRKTIEQLRRLFSSYGLPEELVSDNGPQFTGSEMKGFLEGNGIKQTLIPAYHPQSNGLAERAVRTIKTALDKNKRKIGDTIQDTLSKVLLAYRSTPHVTTGKTPSELFIGRALRTRVSLIHPSLASRVRDQQARQMKYDRRTHLEEFQIDDLVWCKNFRGGDKWIPGKIVGKKGTRVYTILIHGQVKAYHRDQIRKRWRNGEEDESGDGEHQPEHSRGAGPSAIISEVVRDRGYMESLSPGLTSQRSDQDSEVQSDTDDGKSLEPLRSLDPEALKEEGPVLRRNPPRARRPPSPKWRINEFASCSVRKNGFKGAEIFWMLQTAYGDAVMSRRRIFEWYKRFKEGREETADNERSERPSTSTTPEKVDKVLELASEWRFKNEPRPKKARKAPSKVKVMLTVFFDYQGIVHHEFQQQGSTITADSYLGVLRRLREAIRQKRPELWRSKSWILHHDNAPAHTALKISKFLKLKKKLKGRKFQSIEEIKVESKKAVKVIPKTDYQRCFADWKKRFLERTEVSNYPGCPSDLSLLGFIYNASGSPINEESGCLESLVLEGWASEEEVVYGLVFILAVGASWVFFRYRCKVCLNVTMAGQDCCGCLSMLDVSKHLEE
ncbi:K02A2.6-like [Cordylochernes scorpioides]|uniref:K02A2.6-like n=1 Tax=Cordylochernes scorpioides TaxID=51811 RepID=A0ABY6JVG3_9ARAC|nr:K02A2.6-like [Cordylochernes scorpioides]